MAQTSTKVTNTKTKHSFLELEKLWVQAGGSTYLAPIMAAIAMAESNGTDQPPSRNKDGTVDTGLWRINSSHQRYRHWNLNDPKQNAKAAVEIYHSQGLNAWTTFRTGAYLKPLKQYGGKNTDVHAADRFLKKHPTAAGLKTASTDPLAALAHSSGIGSGPGIVDKTVQSAGNAVGLGDNPLGGIEGAVLLGLKEGMYALAILGGAMLIILGLLFIGVDVGLSSLSKRASSHPVVRLANRATTRKSSSGGALPEDSGGGNLPGPEA